MPFTPSLRRAAEAEAARIHEARTRTCAAATPDDIPVTTIGTSANSGLERPGVIFFVRAGISDSAGRLLERIVVAVKLPLPGRLNGRRRRDVRAQAQDLCDRCAASVIAVARGEIVRRADTIAAEYGQQLERASRREEQIAELLAGGPHLFVQSALFDRRALKHRESVLRQQSSAAADSALRLELLRLGPLALGVQSLELALLLIVRRRA